MEERNDNSGDLSEGDVTQDPWDLVATALRPTGERSGILVQARGFSVVIPMTLTARTKTAALEERLIEHQLETILDQMPRSDVGTILRTEARKLSVVVIATRGAHLVIHEGREAWVYVWDGRIRQLSGKSLPRIVLTEDALTRASTRGSFRSFTNVVGKIARKNPRVLVSFSFALSAAPRRPLGEPAQAEWMWGGTTMGKNSTQLPISAMTGPPKVEQWDATRKGVKLLLESTPDQPAMIDEAHLADSWDDIDQVLMAVGNSAARKIANSNLSLERGAGLYSLPIFSSNKTLEQLSPRGVVEGQIQARVFTVRATGKWGMFDHLLDYGSAAELAEALEQVGRENYGKVWIYWIRQLSKHRHIYLEEGKTRVAKMAAAIQKKAGVKRLNALDSRVLKRLAFSAFAGDTARQLGILKVKAKDVIKAFALMLNEYLENSPKSGEEREEEILAAVGEYIERNLMLFPSIDAVLKASLARRQLGYVEVGSRTGDWYYCLPDQFRLVFEKRFGKDVYDVLKRRGLLRLQKSRHFLYEKRVVTPSGAKKKKFFIAISASILHSSGGA